MKNEQERIEKIINARKKFIKNKFKTMKNYLGYDELKFWVRIIRTLKQDKTK